MDEWVDAVTKVRAAHQKLIRKKDSPPVLRCICALRREKCPSGWGEGAARQLRRRQSG